MVRNPEEVQPEWFKEGYSLIILFSTAKFPRYNKVGRSLDTSAATSCQGCETIALPEPKNKRDWKKTVDMLRDLCEERLAQRHIEKQRQMSALTQITLRNDLNGMPHSDIRAWEGVHTIFMLDPLE